MYKVILIFMSSLQLVFLDFTVILLEGYILIIGEVCI